MVERDVKRLYRSEEDKIIAGVCGGIADYLEIDPVWIRLINLVLVFFNGVGILIYVILWILMPMKPINGKERKSVLEEKAEGFSKTIKHEFKKEVKEKAKKNNISEGEVIDKYSFKRHERNSNVIGIILILLGVLFLIKEFAGHFFEKYFWGILLIGVGLLLLLKR